MANDILSKAEAIKRAYSGSTSWSQKVDKMSETQIQAVYLRFKNQNKI